MSVRTHDDGEGIFESPHDIAAELRRLAERLEALPNTAIPNTRVALRLQTFDLGYDADGTPRDYSTTATVEAVDLLAYAVSGQTGSFDTGAPTHYGLPRGTYSNGIDIDVVTVVRDTDHAVADLEEAWS